MLLKCYSTMSAEEKAERTRKFSRALPLRDLETLEEFLDVMGASGLKTENPSSMGMPLLNYGMEYPRIDQFYNDVFFT